MLTPGDLSPQNELRIAGSDKVSVVIVCCPILQKTPKKTMLRHVPLDLLELVVNKFFFFFFFTKIDDLL